MWDHWICCIEIWQFLWRKMYFWNSKYKPVLYTWCACTVLHSKHYILIQYTFAIITTMLTEFVIALICIDVLYFVSQANLVLFFSVYVPLSTYSSLPPTLSAPSLLPISQALPSFLSPPSLSLNNIFYVILYNLLLIH